MKKILFLLAALVMSVSSVWAQGTTWVPVTSITASTSVSNPEHVYTLTSCNDASYKWSPLTHPVTTDEGTFAFYSVDGKESTYRIYSIGEGKWLTYNKANSNTNMQSFITVDEETQDNAGYFKVTYVTGSGGANGVSGFIMAPYSASDAATGKYLNWNGGIAGCIGKTLGLWQDSNTDKGSIWTVKELQEVEPYPYNFTNVNIPQSARKIMSATIGGVTVDFSDNNSKCYNDNTTKTFRIEKTDQPLTTKFTLNGGSWIHGYLYIDLNKDKQFTVSNPVELVTKTTNQSTSPDLAQTGSWATFACPEIGTYRMRLKTDWADTNPGGSSSFTTSQTSGQIIDVILEVVAPTAKANITYNYFINEEKVGTETIQAQIGEDYPNPSEFPFYTLSEKPAGKVSVDGEYNINLTWDGPFVADGTTTYALGVRLNGEGSASYYVKSDGTNAPSHSATTVQNTAEYLWMFERVAGTADQFYLKNKKYGYINTNSGSKSTMHETNKTPMQLYVYTGTNHNSANKDFGFVDVTNANQVFGDHQSSNLGYWNNGSKNDAGSAFQVVATEEPAFNWTLFENKLNEVKSYTIGSGFGQYSCTVNESEMTATNVNTYVEAWQQTLTDKDESYYEGDMSDMGDFIAGMSLNMPKPNTFLRIKGLTSSKYITGNGTSGQVVLSETADINTVLYYDESNHLIGYVNGRGFNGTHSVAGIGSFETHTFSEAPFKKGCYLIKSNYTGSKVLCDWTDGKLNRWGSENDTRSTWELEEVESLPVEFKEAGQGWATLYAPVALTIPSGVTAYTLTEEEDYLKATSIDDNVIPAETGVVLFAETTGTTNFAISSEEGTVDNENVLVGTVAAKAAGDDKYVFSIVGGQAGFYKFGGNNLAGFKAYIESNVETQGFVINFGGLTTGINAAQQAQSQKASFDLQGRRVSKATRGLFIQNGQKVIR